MAGSVLGGCTLEDNPVSGPDLLIQKLDEEAGCYVACEGQAASTAAPPSDTCPGAETVNCGFAGGADRVRVLADYGDVLVDPQKQLKPPVLTLIADGVELPTKPAFVQRAPGTSEARFEATFLAPAQQVATLLARVTTETGFGGEIIPLSVEKPAPRLRIEGCSSSQDVTCERQAGVGKLKVTVLAPQGYSGQEAVIFTFVGEVSKETSTVTLGQPVLDDETGMRLALGSASFDTPIDEGTKWKLLARVGGYSSADHEVSIGPLAPALAVGNCPEPGACACPATGPCERQAGVGRLEVIVSASKDLLNKKGTVVAMVNQVVRQTNEVTLDGSTGKVSTFFDTPPDEAADWVLQAHFGASTSDKLVIKLVPPVVGFSVTDCPTPPEACQLPAKSNAAIKITAPKSMLDKEALVTWTVDGIPKGVAVPVSLGDLEQDPQTGLTARVGIIPMFVPDEPNKLWQLKVVLGESVRFTAPIKIGAATP